MKEEAVNNVNAGAIMEKYADDIPSGYGRVILLNNSGEPRDTHGGCKHICESDEGRNVLNVLCAGASAYKNGGQVVLVFKEVGSDNLQIRIHSGTPIFKDPVP